MSNPYQGPTLYPHNQAFQTNHQNQLSQGQPCNWFANNQYPIGHQYQEYIVVSPILPKPTTYCCDY
jgi:hypothetical protein